jgi:hypothetical protein
MPPRKLLDETGFTRNKANYFNLLSYIFVNAISWGKLYMGSGGM